MRVLISFFFIICFSTIQSQSEKEQIISVIQSVFDGMRAGDSSMVAKAFYEDIEMKTIFTDKSGNPQFKKSNLQGFLNAVGTPSEKVFDEHIYAYDVQIDDRLASVWTPYAFYLGSERSHCGVNNFQLF
ncbi:MAG: hypothetical protein AAGK97_12055, partial [Bacteroidota bacterium]